MTRLSDEELARLDSDFAEDGDVDMVKAHRAIIELRQSRAAALTEEEREALQWLRAYGLGRLKRKGLDNEPYATNAIAILDRLLLATKGEP